MGHFKQHRSFVMALSIISCSMLLMCGAISVQSSDLIYTPSSQKPPTPQREFRGAWVASVVNIDWPSKTGLSSDEQRAELSAIMDRAVQLKLNAIILQIRPSCDALYQSRLEPWSEYLSGQTGKPPDPIYDPLEFAVEQAHKRGIELHAWFNPYRARHFMAKSDLSSDHIGRMHPELVKSYGKYLWLDPGEKAVVDHSLEVVLDVVKRYDIDGVHIDDYFYPYKEKDSAGKIIPFPDDTSWGRYRSSGGQLSRDDWRRDNVNRFIERLYNSVKKEKPWVKVGISPFGIWRPGNPVSIRGLDSYDELYGDSRLWLRKGWLDYCTPQLYWKISQSGQQYPVLLKWWVEQNAKKRHIWPGNHISRVDEGGKSAWPASEIVDQISRTRAQSGASGNIHFSMKSLMNDASPLSSTLESSVYSQPAIVPASPWLGREPLGKPTISVKEAPSLQVRQIEWTATGKGKVWQWLVQKQINGKWLTDVYPSEQNSFKIITDSTDSSNPIVAITPIDRYGNFGPIVVIELK